MKRTLEWEVLSILDNPANMSQHVRRVYWTDEIIRLVRAAERQRIVALLAEKREQWRINQFREYADIIDYAIAAIEGSET